MKKPSITVTAAWSRPSKTTSKLAGKLAVITGLSEFPTDRVIPGTHYTVMILEVRSRWTLMGNSEIPLIEPEDRYPFHVVFISMQGQRCYEPVPRDFEETLLKGGTGRDESGFWWKLV